LRLHTVRDRGVALRATAAHGRQIEAIAVSIHAPAWGATRLVFFLEQY